MQNSPIATQFLPGTATVSGIVGHELKNIVVMMQGFIELTAENTTLSAPVRQCFDEMSTGIARVGALASELESLANEHAEPRRIAVGECVQDAEWRCDPAATIVADPYHARAAIQALTCMEKKAPGLGSAALLIVEQGQTDPVNCAVCGETLLPARRYLCLQVRKAGLSRDDALSEWGRPGNPDRTVRRLTLAVLVHSAHLAGGHIVINEPSHLIALAFPTR